MRITIKYIQPFAKKKNTKLVTDRVIQILILVTGRHKNNMYISTPKFITYYTVWTNIRGDEREWSTQFDWKNPLYYIILLRCVKTITYAITVFIIIIVTGYIIVCATPTLAILTVVVIARDLIKRMIFVKLRICIGRAW